MNAVWLLSQKEGISEDEALERVKSKILSLDKIYKAAAAELIKKDAISAETQRYMTSLCLACGGFHVFHTTTSRCGPVVKQTPSTHWALTYTLRRMTVVFAIAFIMGCFFNPAFGEFKY